LRAIYLGACGQHDLPALIEDLLGDVARFTQRLRPFEIAGCKFQTSPCGTERGLSLL
jgi:hypothetical protein